MLVPRIPDRRTVFPSTVSGIGDRSGYRWGIGILAVGVIVSGAIYLTVRKFIARDITQAFQTLSTEI